MKRRILRQVRDWALFLVIGFLLFHFMGQWRAPELPETAPDFALVDLDNQPVNLSDFRGQPVVLNFWATWWSVQNGNSKFLSIRRCKP